MTSGDARYTLAQLRGAWGAGYWAGRAAAGTAQQDKDDDGAAQPDIKPDPRSASDEDLLKWLEDLMAEVERGDGISPGQAALSVWWCLIDREGATGQRALVEAANICEHVARLFLGSITERALRHVAERLRARLELVQLQTEHRTSR